MKSLWGIFMVVGALLTLSSSMPLEGSHNSTNIGSDTTTSQSTAETIATDIFTASNGRTALETATPEMFEIKLKRKQLKQVCKAKAASSCRIDKLSCDKKVMSRSVIGAFSGILAALLAVIAWFKSKCSKCCKCCILPNDRSNGSDDLPNHSQTETNNPPADAGKSKTKKSRRRRKKKKKKKTVNVLATFITWFKSKFPFCNWCPPQNDEISSDTSAVSDVDDTLNCSRVMPADHSVSDNNDDNKSNHSQTVRGDLSFIRSQNTKSKRSKRAHKKAINRCVSCALIILRPLIGWCRSQFLQCCDCCPAEDEILCDQFESDGNDDNASNSSQTADDETSSGIESDSSGEKDDADNTSRHLQIALSNPSSNRSRNAKSRCKKKPKKKAGHSGTDRALAALRNFIQSCRSNFPQCCNCCPSLDDLISSEISSDDDDDDTPDQIQTTVGDASSSKSSLTTGRSEKSLEESLNNVPSGSAPQAGENLTSDLQEEPNNSPQSAGNSTNVQPDTRPDSSRSDEHSTTGQAADPTGTDVNSNNDQQDFTASAETNRDKQLRLHTDTGFSVKISLSTTGPHKERATKHTKEAKARKSESAKPRTNTLPPLKVAYQKRSFSEMSFCSEEGLTPIESAIDVPHNDKA